MAARRIEMVLVLGACLAVLAWKALAEPKPVYFPSKLEKSCPAGPFYVPCFIKDGALQQTWDI